MRPVNEQSLSPESKRLLQRMVRPSSNDKRERNVTFAKSPAEHSDFSSQKSIIYMNKDPSAMRHITINRKYDPESYEPINEPFFRKIRLRRLYQDPIPWEYYLQIDDEEAASSGTSTDNVEQVVVEPSNETAQVNKKDEIVATEERPVNDAAIQTMSIEKTKTRNVRNKSVESKEIYAPRYYNRRAFYSGQSPPKRHSAPLSKRNPSIPKRAQKRKIYTVYNPPKPPEPIVLPRKPPVPRFPRKKATDKKDEVNEREKSPILVVRAKSPIHIRIDHSNVGLTRSNSDSEINRKDTSMRQDMIQFIRKSLAQTDMLEQSLNEQRKYKKENIDVENEIEEKDKLLSQSILLLDLEDIEKKEKKTTHEQTRKPTPPTKTKIVRQSISPRVSISSARSEPPPRNSKPSIERKLNATTRHSFTHRQQIKTKDEKKTSRPKSPTRKSPTVTLEDNDSYRDSLLRMREAQQHSDWMDQYIERITADSDQISTPLTPKKAYSSASSPARLDSLNGSYLLNEEESEEEAESGTTATASQSNDSDVTISYNSSEFESRKSISTDSSSTYSTDSYESEQLEELERVLAEQHQRLIDRGYIKKKTKESSVDTGTTALAHELLDDISTDEDVFYA